MVNIKIAVLCGLVMLSVLSVLVLPAPLLAVNCNTNEQCVGVAGTPLCSRGVCVSATQWFQNLITNILNMIVWPIFIGLAIIMFVWAGILFLSANGDPGKIGEAKKAAIWGVIGVIVGLMGYVMVGVLRGLLGL